MLSVEHCSQVKLILESFSDILRNSSAMNSCQDQSKAVNMPLWLWKCIRWKMMAISATRGMTALPTSHITALTKPECGCDSLATEI